MARKGAFGLRRALTQAFARRTRFFRKPYQDLKRVSDRCQAEVTTFQPSRILMNQVMRLGSAVIYTSPPTSFIAQMSGHVLSNRHILFAKWRTRINRAYLYIPEALSLSENGGSPFDLTLDN